MKTNILRLELRTASYAYLVLYFFVMQMDQHSGVLLRHLRASIQSLNTRRPVPVTVRIDGGIRNRSRNLRTTDINNNQTRVIHHPVNPPTRRINQQQAMLEFLAQEPVSVAFAILQVRYPFWITE